MTTTPKSLNIDGITLIPEIKVANLTINLLSDFDTLILPELKKITIDIDTNTTIGVFFTPSNLYKVPDTIDVSKCEPNLVDIFNKLKAETGTVAGIIDQIIKNNLASNKEEYKTIVSNFNKIKTLFSRVYVCVLVYQKKHESGTSDYQAKIDELKDFLKNTTTFLLKIDEFDDKSINPK